MAAKTLTAADGKVQAYDPIWSEIRREATSAMAAEPALGSFIFATLLSHDRLEDAICHRLAQRLDHAEVDAGLINQTFQAVLDKRPELGGIFRADLAAVFDRDPACNRYIEPLLYFKGFHALGDAPLRQRAVARRAARLRAVPAEPVLAHLRRRYPPGRQVRPGHHARPRHRHRHRRDGEVGDNCSFLHGVTLGGSGKETGDRHPKIGESVLIGAGAKVLGNITVGDCSRVAAGSVVLHGRAAARDGRGRSGQDRRLGRQRRARPRHGTDLGRRFRRSVR